MATTKQPLGVSYPVTHGPQGYFGQTWSTEEMVRNQILTLLNTKKGERRMNLGFGSDLWSLLFEINDDNLPAIIESAIKNDVKTWLPYVNVQGVSIDNGTNLRDKYQVNISVQFTAPTAGITSTQTVNLSIPQGNV